MKRKINIIKKIALIVAGLLILIGVSFLFDFSPRSVDWGVTFSPEYARDELGLDWQKTFLAILDDLKVDHLRLSAYWDELEPQIDQYDFADLDWQINEASKRGVKIILAVGRKLPRWPECHDPNWLKTLSDSEIQNRQKALVEKVVNRYKNNEQIIAWQVENEPYLSVFGQCPLLDKDFFLQEVALVKQISPKPIIVTDSGELNFWTQAANSGNDLVGITIYRVVYNKHFGYLRYFWPPAFYYLKTKIVKLFSDLDEVIVAELQAEAWHPEGKTLKEMTAAEQDQSMSLTQFKKNIAFSRQAGFDRVYLWGAEWWYYLKEKKQDDRFWQEAKKLWP